MRKTLIAAVALAPLCFMASAASATTTVSNGRTTAIDTATANAGAADDVSIVSGGSVTLSTGGTVAAPVAEVTLDSNNIVTNTGTIQTKNISNMVGVLVQGGNTGTLTNAGAITLTSDFTAVTNSDGYTQGPLAGTASPTTPTGTGNYGLYGIRVTGASPFVGSIANSTGGVITIKGNNSYGVSIEAPLTGGFFNSGTINVTGDNSFGLRTTSNASTGGDIQISAGITAAGVNSTAVSLQGDIGGRLTVNSSVTSSGYTLTSRPTDPTLLSRVQDSTNHQSDQGGSAMVVGGSVNGGIYIGGAPAGTVSGSTADLTGDGVVDGAEGTGSIVTYGSSPALVIGSTRNIVIGGFSGLNGATQDNGYGLIVRGSVSAAGLFDNISATAVQIGGSGGATVSLSSGATVYGTIGASSYNADATAVHLLSGVTGTNFRVDGTISASINASTSAVTGSALLIDAGSTVNNLTVTGALLAGTTGDNATAYAVRDLGGGISSVVNEGAIAASTAATALGDVQTGKAVALDLSHNTTGVTLVQQVNPSPTHLYGSVSGATTTASTTNTAVTPSITGDVYLGSGTNNVSLLAGTLTGALGMGSGTGGSLLIDNGAVFTGALTYTGSGLAINVANGTLADRSASTVNISTLNVGAGSTLAFAADPANNSASKFVATGAVTIASGAKFDLTLLSTPVAAQSYVLIQSPNLTVGSTTSALLASAPFLLSANITTNTAAGTVNLDIRRRTATEMGLNASEGAILDAALTASNLDPEVQKVLLAPTARTPFLKVFDEMLPDSAGAIFQAARSASEAVSRATAATDQIPGAAGTRGLWAQQIVVGGHSSRTDQNVGYDIGGFGVVGGAAYGGTGLGAFGVTAAFTTLSTSNPDIKGDSQQAVTTYEAGAYWQGTINHLALDARLGVGYIMIDGRRQFYALDSAGNIAINRKVTDNRSGISLTAHVGAGYEMALGGGFYLRPQGHLDFFQLDEDGYTENDPVSSGFALKVNSRSGNAATGEASVVFGRTWGTDFRVRPELEVGVRDSFSGDAGKTTARFVSGTQTFTLTPSDISGAGGIVRLGVKAATDFYEIGLSAGAEARDKFYSGDARVTVRLLF